MAEPDADVVIIGAGPAGGVAALRLVEAGLRVVCLEQGAWPDPAAYPGATPEAELLAATSWSSNPAVRRAPADYPVGVSGSDVGILNFNGVGGGTVLYNAQWPRMRPDDFRVRTVDGVADDWPLGYDELLPHYEEVDRQMGVSGLGGNPAYPPGEDPPLPPLPIGELGLRVARAHARLGWHWWPAPNAILSAPYADRHPCVQRGTCGSGCNEGAKASADITHWRRVVERGGRVITGARVRRIVVDRAGLAAGAEWVDHDGRSHLQRADVVVCAANAIGTARLLLASTSAAHPDGLANSSGLVGRRLMLHPLATVAGLFDGPPTGWRAHNGGLVQSLEFSASAPERGFVRGATWELGSAAGPLRALFSPDGEGRWGAEHHAHVAERFGRTAQWAILGEDLPDEANRIVLSPDATDADGLPAPDVHYRLSENSRALMDFQVERASESLREAGAWHVEHRAGLPNGHLMGTARMGDDPATSVLDRWNAAHDVPNLLVVDGSAFVTAGSANPTSTITALALRAADHLVAERGSVPRPSLPTTVAGIDWAPGSSDPPDAVATPARPVPLPRPGLDHEGRRRLAALAEALVPADGAMPSAAEVDVAGALVDRVLAARPDLAEGLAAALAGDDPPAEALERLAATDPTAVRALRHVVAGGYYLDPGVRERLGWRTDEVGPVPAFAYPEWLDEGLLDHLVDP